MSNRPHDDDAYWAVPPETVLRDLGSSAAGLTPEEAAERLARDGANELRRRAELTRLRVLVRQLRNPLLLLLVFAAVISAVTRQWLDGAIVSAIVVVSVMIGWSREYRAQRAAALLGARLRSRVRVVRGGVVVEVERRALVRGDVVLLGAGTLVPADLVLIDANDLFVNEAILTGESFPAAKQVGPVAPSAPLAARTGCAFLGTNVRSGTARGVVVATGGATRFGAIAHRLTLRPPETDFERGLRRFGAMLTAAMAVIVIAILAVDVLLGRPPLATLLFAIALAVGLSPELLPAILSVNLARGAQAMAGHGVLVKRLAAIEDLGSMDVLCTDKTGTLTEGVVRLDGAYDLDGRASAAVLELAARNAALQTGLANPLDQAIVQAHRADLAGVVKRGEVPYDFVRKRLSVVVEDAAGVTMITKGAVVQVLDACRALPPEVDAGVRARFEAWSRDGTRVLAVATRAVDARPGYGRDDERDLELVGFLAFVDRPKADARDAIASLRALGVAVKVITGDTRLVARHVAAEVGLGAEAMLTGPQLDELHDEALWAAAERTDVFAEVDPNQKERIILALKKTGHVVGFLGDGVNDAPAMHAADTSVSVAEAVDVAREAADFVLLERDLDVIRQGVVEGRRTFANTLKYVLTTTSANLGNMVSMAVASIFLTFLPLTAGQILLNNFLSDVPAFGLADDRVDPELVDRPRRWNMRFIGRFMVEFGLLSSVFDAITFATLLLGFGASVAEFQTGWFVASLLTEVAIALVVRTRGPALRSRPGAGLLVSSVVIAAAALGVSYLPGTTLLGFTPLPPALLLAIVTITAAYVLAAEALKRVFYRPGLHSAQNAASEQW